MISVYNLLTYLEIWWDWVQWPGIYKSECCTAGVGQFAEVSLGGGTAMPVGLHARFCHALLVHNESILVKW